VSLPTLDPAQLLAVGRRLAPLRDEGVLILGSGFFTHNVREMRGAADEMPPSWSAEFDEWGARAVAAGDLDALIDFEHRAPAGRLAHPRTEHFAPLFVSLGAVLGTGNTVAAKESVIDGFWHGLSKRSYQFD
jgi:4,5-DOPA dioxygenase extradiol